MLQEIELLICRYFCVLESLCGCVIRGNLILKITFNPAYAVSVDGFKLKMGPHPAKLVKLRVDDANGVVDIFRYRIPLEYAGSKHRTSPLSLQLRLGDNSELSPARERITKKDL